MRTYPSMLFAAVLLLPQISAAQTQPSGPAKSAFEIRGLKGLWWAGIDKYYKALPWMAEHHMNWLMLCYTAYPESGKDWRKNYTDQHLAEMKELVTRANDVGVSICLSFNPGIWSKPPLCHFCEDDYQAAWRKVEDAHMLGINWIGLCLDDISRALLPADKEKYGTLQEAQVAFANRMWRDMKRLSPDMRLIFCPSAYTTQDMKAHMDYTLTVGEKLDPEIEIFWTGPTVVSKSISVADANEVAKWLRRKPFVWDNYPVNDMFPWRPLLAPLDGRAPNLAGEVSGILFNPMKQWEANKIPLVSVAAYLNDPAGYDRTKMDEAVLADYAPADRPAVALLLKYYGSAFVGEKNYPPGPVLDGGNREQVLVEIAQLRSLLSEGSPAMRALWLDVKDTVDADLKNAEILAEGPVYFTRTMKGGAARLAQQAFADSLALVYAKPTGVNVARGEMPFDMTETTATRLRIMARNGDGKKPRVRISINDVPVIEGETEFSQSDFEPRIFPIPTSAKKPGPARLQMENLETTGTKGMPPWFAVKWVQLLD